MTYACPYCYMTTGGCNGACRQIQPNVPLNWPTAQTPKGCICPPGSEKTCERSDCGRKDYRVSATTTVSVRVSDENPKGAARCAG